MEKKNYKELQKTRPVVFIHTGDSFYLKHTIGQALNSCSRVVLLGDQSNVGYVPEHYYIEDFESEKLNAFKKAYINMSWNNYNYVFGCYTRFFILAEFMERFQLKDIVMVDSDLMIYEDLSQYDFGADLAASLPPDMVEYGWTCSPHVFYATKEAIVCFIEWMIEFYSAHADILQEKWLYHAVLGTGDVIDMTLLYLFIRQCSLKTRNLYGVCVDNNGSNAIFDHNYNVSQVECRMLSRGGVKAVEFKKGIPFFTNPEGDIRAYTIHLQGKAKFYIDCMTRKNVNSVLGRLVYIWRRIAVMQKKAFSLFLHKNRF